MVGQSCDDGRVQCQSEQPGGGSLPTLFGWRIVETSQRKGYMHALGLEGRVEVFRVQTWSRGGTV